MRKTAGSHHVSRAMRIGWFVALILLGAVDASACTSRRNDDSGIAARRWLPLTEAPVQRAPAQQAMPIGSIHAYLVPTGTQATIKSINQGMTGPLEVLAAETVERVRKRLRFDVRGGGPGDTPVGQEWLYVHASSFGKAELRLTAPGGWAYAVVLGMVYPQPQPVGDPQVLDEAEQSVEHRFSVDANRNTLWLSIAGRVDDGWRIASGAETSFALVRIEQLEVPYGDQPRVGLFLVASRSVRSGQIEIQSGRGLLGPKSTHRIKVEARPVPAC